MVEDKCILQDPQTNLYVSSKSTKQTPWMLTKSIEEAMDFRSPTVALDYCKQLNSLVTLNVLRVNIGIKNLKPITRLDTVLARNTHLDATHIGQKGNPYVYFYDAPADQAYSWDEQKWVKCEFTGVKQLLPITIYKEGD